MPSFCAEIRKFEKTILMTKDVRVNDIRDFFVQVAEDDVEISVKVPDISLKIAVMVP